MHKIILVEDDESIQDVVNKMLVRAGYEVTSYRQGEAILNGQTDIPDLFILDKQLTGVDGLDICRYLKDQTTTSHIPVIMLSANPDIVNLALDAGADGVIEKPFTMKTLLATVSRHLDRK